MFPIGNIRMPTIHDSIELGALIRERRRAQGLRQEELALAAGTGRRFIGEVENGKPTARVGDVLNVLAALGLVIDVRARTPPGDHGRDART
jgi:y4mF family transcriptional regulator